MRAGPILAGVRYPVTNRATGAGRKDRKGSAAIGWFLFLARPARLIAALLGAAAVGGASLATIAIAHSLDLGSPGLASVLGGLITLNTLLFFAPGALGFHPPRVPLVLAANLAPLVAIAWLHSRAPWAADLALLLITFGAVLARSADPLVNAFSLTVLMNVLVALLLGSAPGFLAIAAIAAGLGGLIGALADCMTAFVLARLGRIVQDRLLVRAAVLFLEDAGRHWKASWRGGWDAPHAKRFATIGTDAALGTMAVDPLGPSELVGVIRRVGSRLYDARLDLPPPLAPEIEALWRNAAEELRMGREGRRANARLRAMIADLAFQGERRELATSHALALALLLQEFVRTIVHPDIPGAPQPRPRSRVGALEWRIAAQAVAAVALGLLVGHLLRAERPYWIALTTVVLTSASFGETLRRSFERLLGTVGGLAAGEVLWLVLAGHQAWLNGVTLLAVAGLFFARAGAYRWLLFWVSMLLALLLNGAGEASLLVGGRLVDTLIGAGIVVIVARVLLPIRAGRVARARADDVLRALAARLRASVSHGNAEAMHGTIAAALQRLRVASDAELLEVGLRRRARERVARRLLAAERIAGAFLSFDSLPLNFRLGAETRAAFTAIAELAERAAARAAPLRAPDNASAIHALMRRAIAHTEHGAALRLELRVLALLAALGQAIVMLAGTIGDERVPPAASEGAEQ